MENRSVLQSAFVAGLLMALIGSIPFADACCCLIYLGGGAIGLYYYNRTFLQIHDQISAATAILLGITTGLMGAFLTLIADWIMYKLFGYWEFDLAKQLIDNINDIPDYLKDMIAEFEKQKTYGFIWAGPLLSNLFTMPVFCIAGSLLTRVFLNDKKNKTKKNIEQ